MSHEFGSPLKPWSPQGAVLRLQRKASLGDAQLLPVMVSQVEQPLLGAAEDPGRLCTPDERLQLAGGPSGASGQRVKACI